MPTKWPPRPQISVDAIAGWAAANRLVLSPGDANALLLQMEQVLFLLDSLDAVDLGETPPAITYSAAWGD